MKYKYYKTWYFLNKKSEVSEEQLSSLKFYYRFYYEPEINCEIGERYLNGGYDHVFYTGKDIEKITAYHAGVFGDNKEFRIIETMAAYTIMLKGYIEGSFTGAEMYNFNEKFLETRLSVFNADYELQQLTDTFYDKNDRVVQEKVFIPSIWQIHTEDY